MTEQNAWYTESAQHIDLEAKHLAEQRQQQLTKPTGALGELEQLAIQLASLQGTVHPQIQKPWITIFAGDHGVVEENISAYPQAVTRQMLQNIASGGAGWCALLTGKSTGLYRCQHHRLFEYSGRLPPLWHRQSGLCLQQLGLWHEHRHAV